MKIYYERDQETGCYLLQWNRAEAIGRDFSAFLTENGRRPVASPPFGRYGERGWLAVTEAQLMEIKSKGEDDKDNRPLEFQEILPGKLKGQTFAASFGSFIVDRPTLAQSIATDPIIARKQAGDFLDEKARTIAAGEGLTYAAAFSRACHDNPEAYQCYRG